MIMQPSRTKFRKYKKVKIRQLKEQTVRSCLFYDRLKFGNVGLKSIESARLSARQIESAKKVIRKSMNKVGFFWVLPFPHIPVTKKSLGVRMGKGKGNISYWVHRLLEGDVLFEINGISKTKAIQILKKASAKIPVTTKIIYRSNIGEF